MSGWAEARRRPGFWIAAAVLAFWAAAAVSAQRWGLPDPAARVGPRYAPPDAARFPLGTDALGRDVLSRTLHGAALSLPLAAAVAAGAAAGAGGRVLDAVLMRVADVTLAFPPVLLTMAMAATLGPGLLNASVAMLAVWWPFYARLMRSQVLVVREMDHVAAAAASGATPFGVRARHVAPLCWAPLLVALPLDLGQVVLLGAGLSFVGLGPPPPAPEWGAMIAEGAAALRRWWLVAAPGGASASVVLACTVAGDAVRRE